MRTRLLRCVLLAGVALSGCAGAPVVVPGTGVSMEPPEGTTQANRYAGFENVAERVAVMVVAVPGPVSALAAGFRDPAKVAAQGMRVERTESPQLPGGTAELLVLRQASGGVEYRKWILLVGDEKRSAMVSAMCPLAVAAKWEPVVRAALGTVTFSEVDSKEAAPFVVSGAGGFRQAQGITGSLAFTRDGQFPLSDPRDPFFVVSRSVQAVSMPSAREFAEARARALPGVKTFRVTGSREVTIDGLRGVELTGVSNEGTGADGQIVFETLLRDEGGYYLMVGLAPVESGAQYVNAFREMSGSFRRTK